MAETGHLGERHRDERERERERHIERQRETKRETEMNKLMPPFTARRKCFYIAENMDIPQIVWMSTLQCMTNNHIGLKLYNKLSITSNNS